MASRFGSFGLIAAFIFGVIAIGPDDVTVEAAEAARILGGECGLTCTFTDMCAPCIPCSSCNILIPGFSCLGGGGCNNGCQDTVYKVCFIDAGSCVAGGAGVGSGCGEEVDDCGYLASANNGAGGCTTCERDIGDCAKDCV